jgi:hypothetical protein
MAKQRKTSSYQSLGNGVYRVTGVVRRSAVTGGYVTESATAGGRQKASERPANASRTPKKNT